MSRLNRYKANHSLTNYRKKKPEFCRRSGATVARFTHLSDKGIANSATGIAKKELPASRKQLLSVER